MEFVFEIYRLEVGWDKIKATQEIPGQRKGLREVDTPKHPPDDR